MSEDDSIDLTHAVSDTAAVSSSIAQIDLTSSSPPSPISPPSPPTKRRRQQSDAELAADEECIARILLADVAANRALQAQQIRDDEAVARQLHDDYRTVSNNSNNNNRRCDPHRIETNNTYIPLTDEEYADDIDGMNTDIVRADLRLPTAPTTGTTPIMLSSNIRGDGNYEVRDNETMFNTSPPKSKQIGRAHV
jgi:hypothetical protein